MPNHTRQFAGWTLREAVRRTTDPIILRDCIIAERSWRRAGRPSRFSWASTYLNGSDADRQNQKTRRERDLFEAQRHTRRQVERHLREHLSSGRLVGWGRRESPIAEPQFIPISAWGALNIKSFWRSIASERTSAKTQIFDLRLYPVLESPDAISILDGATALEAFRDFVFGDPQVVAMQQRAKAIQGKPHELGFQDRLLESIWPVDYGVASAWNSPMGFLQRADNPKAYVLSRAANFVLGRRFARLVNYLVTGKLVADGISRLGEIPIEVPRSLWQRERSQLDLKNGDLLEYLPDANDYSRNSARPLFTALTLRKPNITESTLHVKHPRSDVLPPTTIEAHSIAERKSTKQVRTSGAAFAACKEWLCSEMRKSPNARVGTKREWQQKATQKWRRKLSQRSFLAAWSDSIRSTNATAWAAAGAPRKRSKTPPRR